MSCITKTDKQTALNAAFDEACDLVTEGHHDAAQHSLERCIPKTEAVVVMEAILIAKGADPEGIGAIQ